MIEFIDLKQHPPNREMLESWVKSLGSSPIHNISSQSYRDLSPDRKDWTDKQWIETFTNNVMLIKRPLIVQGGVTVMVGFRDKDDVLRQKLG